MLGRVVVALLLGCLALGCGAADPVGGPGPDAGLLVQFSETGGVAGVGNELTIAGDGSTIARDKLGVVRRRRLTAATVADVRRALDAADLEELRASYPRADAGVDALTSTVSSRGRTVQSQDGAGPEPLQRLISRLSRLASQLRARRG